ncbi:MAG TPA: hypothetical protein VIL84_03965 [Devosiaceae bacterium]
MFVRAVWRRKRPVDNRQTLRELGLPVLGPSNVLGIGHPDFASMTRGLFDR